MQDYTVGLIAGERISHTLQSSAPLPATTLSERKHWQRKTHDENPRPVLDRGQERLNQTKNKPGLNQTKSKKLLLVSPFTKICGDVYPQVAAPATAPFAALKLEFLEEQNCPGCALPAQETPEPPQTQQHSQGAPRSHRIPLTLFLPDSTRKTTVCLLPLSFHN